MKLSDYVGCNLFSFLYAVPLLKHHKASFVTATCLRNTPTWKSIDSFNNESVMINDSERLFKLLQVKYAGNFEDPDELFPHPWALGDYLKWSSPVQGAYPFNMLLPRAAFCNWLYGLFFKLALPAIRDHNHEAFGTSMMVYAPCTLVVFFRLLMHLRSIGYPSHWLSTVLGSILADNVSTSARPPATCPLDIEEVNHHKPPEAHPNKSVYRRNVHTDNLVPKTFAFRCLRQRGRSSQPTEHSGMHRTVPESGCSYRSKSSRFCSRLHQVSINARGCASGKA
jgi:hypothetical protein